MDGVTPHWDSTDVPNAKTIAILTSGGDAPGMNAALRSCVAVSLARGAHIYSIKNVSFVRCCAVYRENMWSASVRHKKDRLSVWPA